VQVASKGACQFEAIWRALSFKDDTKALGAWDCEAMTKLRFTVYRLRLLAVYAMYQFAMLVSAVLCTFVLLCGHSC